MTTAGWVISMVALSTAIGLAGTVKALKRREYRDAVKSWQLPRPLEAVAFVVLPAGEIAIAVIVLVATAINRWLVIAAATLGVLTATLLVGQLVVWLFARSPQCGCFGTPSKIGLRSVTRTGVFCATALLLLASAPH